MGSKTQVGVSPRFPLHSDQPSSRKHRGMLHILPFDGHHHVRGLRLSRPTHPHDRLHLHKRLSLNVHRGIVYMHSSHVHRQPQSGHDSQHPPLCLSLIHIWTPRIPVISSVFPSSGRASWQQYFQSHSWLPDYVPDGDWQWLESGSYSWVT